MRELLLLERVILAVALMAVNSVIRLRTAKCPIDYDTSQHLYFAFLRKRRVPFLSSYRVGIKYLLPRLYAALPFDTSRRATAFRWLNWASCLTIGLLVATDPALAVTELPVYGLMSLLIGSLWVNHYTSAAEFHESVVILSILVAPTVLSFPTSWLVQIGLLLVMSLGFKLTSVLYLVPVILGQIGEMASAWPIVAGAAAVALPVGLAYGNAVRKGGKLGGGRRVLNLKTIQFVAHTPLFWLVFLAMTVGNLWHAASVGLSAIAVALLVVALQRYALSYFMYPSVVIAIWVATQSGWTETLPSPIPWLVLLAVFTFHTLPKILLRSPKEIDANYRRLIGARHWPAYLANRERQVRWISENVPAESSIYLWGTKVSLLLLANRTHVPGVYYSHEHVLNWSTENVREYGLRAIHESRARYVVEAEPLTGFPFPEEELESAYACIAKIEDMRVFKREASSAS